jgi:hypothetical protein
MPGGGGDGNFLGRRGIDYLRHGDSQVTFVVNTMAIADQQYLGGFVANPKDFGYLVGDRPVIEQVKIIEINGFWLLGAFQPAFDDGAGRATGTVFKDQLGTVGGAGFDVFQLRLRLKWDPIHGL